MRNRIKCLDCGEILESKHRHDWVSCKCGNFVDGGHDYKRIGGNLDRIVSVDDNGNEIAFEQKENTK